MKKAHKSSSLILNIELAYDSVVLFFRMLILRSHAHPTGNAVQQIKATNALRSNPNKYYTKYKCMAALRVLTFFTVINRVIIMSVCRFVDFINNKILHRHSVISSSSEWRFSQTMNLNPNLFAHPLTCAACVCKDD